MHTTYRQIGDSCVLSSLALILTSQEKVQDNDINNLLIQIGGILGCGNANNAEVDQEFGNCLGRQYVEKARLSELRGFKYLQTDESFISIYKNYNFSANNWYGEVNKCNIETILNDLADNNYILLLLSIDSSNNYHAVVVYNINDVLYIKDPNCNDIKEIKDNILSLNPVEALSFKLN